MKNKYRSYKYFSNVNIAEIHKHVKTSVRNKVDSNWHKIAKTAAVNGCTKTGYYGGNYCGAQGVNFLYPTNAPLGYFNVLKYINEHKSVRLSEIKRDLGKVPSITLSRLCDGGLIDHDYETHLWSVTELGTNYINSAHPTLITRKVSYATSEDFV